ncbi:MAG: UDP-3-O-(3-hydroxymyristoyl)glucosamine N-acyltransferase [Flavobacteriaceae bacterium]|nr:UDP-3-O-(3-hydroxymyristoyl)glucosamine N-acyltransferase [Flavobacteriaceae bacterium]MDG1779837.1 UDP-3-O-(3-hydroxymyristoyl)glucosamine N-acyltransferase [Flavobacteriales bacterium]
MEFSAQQIADILQGSVQGDANMKVDRLAKIEEGTPGSLTFLANPKYAPYIYETQSSIAIVSADFEPENSLPDALTLIRVEDAYAAFAKLLDFYNSYQNQKTGIHPAAVVDEGAEVGEDVYIGAGAYVASTAKVGAKTKIYPGAFVGDRVSIGEGCTLYAGARILDGCEVGNHCTFHAGAVIGSDGFGFAPDAANNYKKVAQIGNVVIADHVEIGANTTVDRATLGSTRIAKGVKLDNLIQVAHNVEIGENTVIAAQTGIAGSTKIGKNCMIGGQVGIVGHITIADEVKIAAQSGVSNSVSKVGEIIQGSPAFNIKSYKMSYINFRRLPQMEDRLRAVEKALPKNTDNSTNE